MRKQILLPFLLFFLSLSAESLAADGGLQTALRAALTYHPAIKGQLAQLTAQGYTVKTAKSDRYPTLSGEMEARDDDKQYGALVVRQPLWAFGKIDYPIDRERSRLEAQELALLQVQRNLMEETAAAYAQLQGIREQLTVAGENVAEHQKLYDRIESRRAGLLASEADVQLARSRLIQAQVQRDQIIAELQVARDEIRSLTQVPVDTGTAVDPALTALPEREAIRHLALKENADILYKQKLIDVARHTVSIQKVASTPTLYARGEWNFLDYEDDTRASITLEGQLDGAGMGIFSRVKAASSQVDAARREWQATCNDVKLRIDNLLTQLDLQSRLQTSREAAVASVRKTRDSYMRQYDTGRKSWLEVLNMQQELTGQRLELVKVDSNRRVYALRIAVLIGRLDGAGGLTLKTKE